MRQDILRELWQRRGEYISGSELASKFGISRVAVWKHIEILKENGYDITGVSGKGYCLNDFADIIIPDDLARQLKTRLIGKHIIFFHNVDSTNEVCKQMIRDRELAEGMVVVAAQQYKGKGRLGRSWKSPRGGLWFSMLLRPDLPLPQLALLSLTFSVAVAQGLSKYTTSPCKIKWPNDVYLEGKKIAGILLELSGELDGAEYVVTGIGININVKSDELPETATSIYENSSHRYNNTDVLEAVLEQIEKYYFEFINNGFESILCEFKNSCIHLGKEIQVHQGAKQVSGINTDIDETGHLILQSDDGIIKISTGDVNILN